MKVNFRAQLASQLGWVCKCLQSGGEGRVTSAALQQQKHCELRSWRWRGQCRPQTICVLNFLPFALSVPATRSQILGRLREFMPACRPVRVRRRNGYVVGPRLAIRTAGEIWVGIPPTTLSKLARTSNRNSKFPTE